MAKFGNSVPATPKASRATSPVRTDGGTDVTYNGAQAYSRDAKSELFLLAITNMVGEETYYESASQRDARFVRLIHQVTEEDPSFVEALIPWLRNTANMRSAPIVAAAEYFRAGGPNRRRVVASAIQRADEPAEMIGYWMSTYGRSIPIGLKRGVADAVARLYTERNVLKYDGKAKNLRFGDVIEITHPTPRGSEQSALFENCISRRHNRENLKFEGLPLLAEDAALQALPEDQRRANLQRAVENQWSWERLAGWLPGGMDAEAWEAIIPSLGYMALLRNLRNFEQANISKATIEAVASRLADPEQVAKSRQFPFRFVSAWKATQSMLWAAPLEAAANEACSNIPVFAGRTKVLIDVSGSMQKTLSEKSSVMLWEAGALFAAALARKGNDVELVAYGTTSQSLGKVGPNQSVLRIVDQVRALQNSGKLGWSTNQMATLDKHYDGEDRVFIFTDEQANPGQSRVLPKIPRLYIFNLGGYRQASVESAPGRHTFGGFSDSSFKAIAMLESFESVGWSDLLAPANAD